MKTDDLINLLACGDVRPPPFPVRRIALTLALGILTSSLMMASFLGVRSDLMQVVVMPTFWIKVIFVTVLSWVGWIASTRLSTPGRRISTVPMMLAIPVVIMWAIVVVTLITASPEVRSELFWGETWRVCPFLIAGLSLPVFAAILRVMREFAPTRLRLGGAAAGLTAGAMAAMIYCLHCPELGAPFVGFWYLLGILIPTAIGAWMGPRVLQW